MSRKAGMYLTAVFLLVLMGGGNGISSSSAQPASAQPPESPDQITRTFTPDADTYSLRSAALANFGDAPFLEISDEPNLEPANWGSIYLRFDLASIPMGVTVQYASILFHLPEGGYGSDCLVGLNVIVEPWDETSLNYENAPTLLAEPTWQKHLAAGVEEIAWDITEIAAAWLAGASRPSAETNGLAISPLGDCGNYAHFLESRESADPPELTISYVMDEHLYYFLGRVVTYTENGARRPLADTVVALYQAYPWDPELGYPLGHQETSTQTNENGDFWLDYYFAPDTPPITHTLVIQSEQVHVVEASAPPPGYATPEGTIRYNPDTPPGFYSENDFVVAPNEVPNWQRWTFSGQVFLATPEEPAPGVAVVLYATHNLNESENVLAGAATDENGRFSLTAELREEVYYPYFFLKVEDYRATALEAISGSGGAPTEDHRLKFEAPPPGDYHDNQFGVSLPIVDKPEPRAPALNYRSQPVAAVIINYNCSCGTASDCQHITNTKVLSAFGEALFSSTEDSLNNYFLENSQDHFWLEKAGLYMAIPSDDPNTTLDESSNCSSGNSMEKDRAHFVEDMLGTQLGFDFEDYDANSDGVVDNSELIVLFAWATPNLGVAKVRGTDPNQIQIGNVKVDLDVASFSVAQDFYTIAHEMAHTLTWTKRSGSPGDNYGGQGNPGAYGLMDNHCSGSGITLTPNTPLTGTARIKGYLPHLDPWNKIQLGWIISDTYSIPSWVTFDPIETDGDLYRVGTSGGEKEYFLVENRDPDSSVFDADLLDSGLAIWHINENYLPDERRVIALERAGGGALSGQATDNCNDDNDNTALWDGTEDFWKSSAPNSRWYSGSDSQVAVACISPPSDEIKAYLSSSWSQTILTHDQSEPNDSYDLADGISAGTYDRNLHASCDTDVYTITHWTNATIGVTVDAFTDAAHTQPATDPSVLLDDDDLWQGTTYQGTGSANGLFKNYGVTYIKIHNSSQPVYYRMVVSNSQATMPPDRFDDQSPAGEQLNNTFVNSALITETIDESAFWYPGLELDELNFHNSADVDYFTFELPPEVSESGHTECLSPSDPLYSPEVVTGSLTVDIVPVIKNAFTIQTFDSSGAQINQFDSKGPWGFKIECPHDHFGDGEITLKLDDPSRAANIYKIQLSYSRWNIRKDFPEWLLLTDPPLFAPIPERYDPRLRFIYPLNDVMRWALLEGGELVHLPTEYLPIRHVVDGPFHLELYMQSGKELDVSLYNSDQFLVGAGGPLSASRAAVDRPFSSDLPEQLPSQVLDIPFLPAGWYAIALQGDSGFTEFWLKFDNRWLYLPLIQG